MKHEIFGRCKFVKSTRNLKNMLFYEASYNQSEK